MGGDPEVYLNEVILRRSIKDHEAIARLGGKGDFVHPHRQGTKDGRGKKGLKGKRKNFCEPNRGNNKEEKMATKDS